MKVVRHGLLHFVDLFDKVSQILIKMPWIALYQRGPQSGVNHVSQLSFFFMNDRVPNDHTICQNWSVTKIEAKDRRAQEDTAIISKLKKSDFPSHFLAKVTDI